MKIIYIVEESVEEGFSAKRRKERGERWETVYARVREGEMLRSPTTKAPPRAPRPPRTKRALTLQCYFERQLSSMCFYLPELIIRIIPGIISPPPGEVYLGSQSSTDSGAELDLDPMEVIFDEEENLQAISPDFIDLVSPSSDDLVGIPQPDSTSQEFPSTRSVTPESDGEMGGQANPPGPSSPPTVNQGPADAIQDGHLRQTPFMSLWNLAPFVRRQLDYPTPYFNLDRFEIYWATQEAARAEPSFDSLFWEPMRSLTCRRGHVFLKPDTDADWRCHGCATIAVTPRVALIHVLGPTETVLSPLCVNCHQPPIPPRPASQCRACIVTFLHQRARIMEGHHVDVREDHFGNAIV